MEVETKFTLLCSLLLCSVNSLTDKTLQARKALRALKGIVKLQAIIRGRAVRRQAMSTLKCLQSIVSIQSQVCARRLQMVEEKCDYPENEEIQDSKDKIIRVRVTGCSI